MRRLLELPYAAYAIVAFGIVIFFFTAPLIVFGPTLAFRRRAGRLGVRAALAACGVPLRVRGLEHLPTGPCVVISNHASYLDGLVLTAALPPHFTFVVQHGAERWPLVGLIIRRMHVTFINRNEARAGARETRRLIRRLQSGESFAVFPEGTFEPTPGLLPFRTGAFLMAARAGAPVVPATILGTRRFFGEGHWLPRHSRLSVELFAPIAPLGSDRAAALALRDGARAIVARHCGEPDLLQTSRAA